MALPTTVGTRHGPPRAGFGTRLHSNAARTPALEAGWHLPFLSACLRQEQRLHLQPRGVDVDGQGARCIVQRESGIGAEVRVDEAAHGSPRIGAGEVHSVGECRLVSTGHAGDGATVAGAGIHRR